MYVFVIGHVQSCYAEVGDGVANLLFLLLGL